MTLIPLHGELVPLHEALDYNFIFILITRETLTFLREEVHTTQVELEQFLLIGTGIPYTNVQLIFG